MLDIIKQNWNRFILFAATLMTLFSEFLVRPPSSGGGDLWFRYGKFLVALLTGMWFLPMKEWSTRNFAWRWWAAAGLAAILSTVAFLHYNDLLDRWTVMYWADQRVVIGETLTDIAKTFREKELHDGLPIDDLRLLKSFGGDPAAVWNAGEVDHRQRILTLWYLATILILASAVIVVAQAAYCVSRAHPKSNTRRSSARA